jgi:hypothetical protein
MNITKEQYEDALDLIKKYEIYNRTSFSKTCCVCKSAVVKTLEPAPSIKRAMWDSGMVTEIQAGFGSSYDMDTFLIAICDDCTTDLLNSNIIEKVNGRN